MFSWILCPATSIPRCPNASFTTSVILTRRVGKKPSKYQLIGMAALMRTFAFVTLLLITTNPCYGNLDLVTLNANTGCGVWIQEAEGTLIISDVPTPMTGDVAL